MSAKGLIAFADISITTTMIKTYFRYLLQRFFSGVRNVYKDALGVRDPQKRRWFNKKDAIK